MLDSLGRLFDTSDFPARWHCGAWTDAHGWLHILSDLAVWSAYFAIPCILAYFVVRRRDVPFRAIFWLFGAFILACGTTHLMEAIIFWHPLYRLAGVIKLLTAVVSWATVIALVPIVPRALALRGPEDLEREIKQRTAELTAANETLRAEVRERQRAEEEVGRLNRELQSRADELQTILDIIPIGVAIAHDPQCHRITHNPYLSELLNVPAWQNASLTAPHDVRPTNFTNYRNGKEVPSSELPMQVACTGAEVRDMELDLVCRGRATRKLLYHARPLFDEQGKVRGSVGACLDVTSRRQAEEALQEANRRKDEFLATLAHELRNPLAPLRNALELMKRGDGDQALQEQARSIMERQLTHMVRLVDDLLDLGRITRGKVQLRKERVDLEAVLHSAIETARPAIEGQGHELNVRLPPQPLHLDADPTRLSQIVANLLNNAAKYTERGGHIWLSAEPQDGVIAISVRDTGIGMPPESLPKIFEMFSQAAPALQRSHGGLGIGLALVRGLVELHGGTVEAHSAGLGKGSEFIVRLPAVEGPEPTPAQGARENRPVSSRHKGRILVVDDNRDAAESLSMILRLLGYEIQSAHDGVEALQAAAAFHPNVVLLDIGMPKMNGYETARRIREQPWGRTMTLIALTGWGQEDDKKRAVEAGFDVHLTKPVEPAALEKLLADLTNGKSRP
jgi:signal transduction histidine kinase/ActR/RegA family two-component response regulator